MRNRSTVVRGIRGSLLIALAGALLVFGIPAASAVDPDPGGPPSGDGVDPIYVPGNPACDDIGFGFGFKINGAPNGTFTFTNPPGELTGGAPSDPNNSVTISNSDGTYFDWAATLGIDAVIVKGGDNANAFVYIPEDEEDTDLHAPINPNNNQPFDVSHVEFCYDYELTVDKTADPTFVRTFQWDIDKTVSPDTWDLFTGDSGTSEYTVTVTKTGSVDSDWAVSGTVTIDNDTPLAATITGVSDSITGFGAVTVECGVTFPYALAAGGTLVCTYSTALPDGTSRTNSATVTTSGTVGGGSDSAAFSFTDPTTVVNDTINVDDTYAGDLGSFSDSGSTTYQRTFTCDDDEGTHNNTATIVETNQSDSASVTVDCYALAVTKDAATSLTRTWDWTIDKSADQTELMLSPGQLFQVNYEVTVDATSTDSDRAVTGNISINNPAPIDATINAVSDIVSPAIAANVVCGVTFPYTLTAGSTLNCTYSADLPDGSNRTNTATATLQNYDYDEDEVGTASGTTDFSHTVNVSFADATVTEIDECVDVTDTNVGVLGTVCAEDAPKTFDYSLWFGAHPDADVILECGENTHTNTATCVTNDTETSDTDDWTVIATVACDQGCTLTPGYWKTHSHHGPAPEDDAWFVLGDVDGDGTSEGADEEFFLSGMTYYEVLWTPPRGNAYYILAHAYIAAKLNILNGASSTPGVDAAITFAENFFSTKTPDSTLTKTQRNQVIAKAGKLDDYNNGLIGPGHCTE